MYTKKKLIFLSIIIICCLIIVPILYAEAKPASPSLLSINTQELEKNISEKEDMWLYIGRDTCEGCNRFSPLLIEVLKSNNKKIYYYNTDKAREESEQELVTILEQLEVKLVPTLIYLKNGKVVKKAIG